MLSVYFSLPLAQLLIIVFSVTLFLSLTFAFFYSAGNKLTLVYIFRCYSSPCHPVYLSPTPLPAHSHVLFLLFLHTLRKIHMLGVSCSVSWSFLLIIIVTLVPPIHSVFIFVRIKKDEGQGKESVTLKLC